MYTDVNVWVAIIIAGVLGCIVTAYFASKVADIPMVMIAAHVGKYIWAVIFAIPVPFFLSMGPSGGGALLVAALWLILAPTIAAKLFFGPKDVSAMTLNTFHCGYAVTVLLVYYVVLFAEEGKLQSLFA